LEKAAFESSASIKIIFRVGEKPDKKLKTQISINKEIGDLHGMKAGMVCYLRVL
jgi:hypothetical protein